VEAERDFAIRPDQPLSRDRTSGERIQHFDNDQVGRLDNVVRHRDLLEFVGYVAVGDFLFRCSHRLASTGGKECQKCHPAGSSVDGSCSIHATLPPGTPTSVEQKTRGNRTWNIRKRFADASHTRRVNCSPSDSLPYEGPIRKAPDRYCQEIE